MTTLAITGVPALDQSGVTIATKLDGYTIKWDAQNLNEEVEVWQNTTNDRSTATRVVITKDTYYDSPTLTVGQTYYVWTRRISEFGIPGNWDLGATAGRSVTVTGVKAANTAIGILSPTTITTSFNGGNAAPLSYETWTETGVWIQFTAPTGAARVSGFISIAASATSITNTSGISIGELISRLRIRNMTTSTDIPGLTLYHTHSLIFADGSSIDNYVSELKTYDYKVDSGYGGAALIPGNVYRIYLDTKKTRSSTNLTFGASINLVRTNSVTEDSATIT